MYKIPDEFYFRLHHIRPRFKSDVENVLLYLAESISDLPQMNSKEFSDKLNSLIYLYPGNSHRTLKTINNWRTEISSLFGFVEYDGKKSKPGRRSIELAQKQDLVEFFKFFLFSFQYPGAHIKVHETLKQIKAGVHLKPAQAIIKVLRYAEQFSGTRSSLSKAEVCHCVMNDLRCTRDHEDPSKTWERIIRNREASVGYDTRGDVIRYAGDILDYMEIANLLVSYDSKAYYLNTLENKALMIFENSNEWFSEYDSMILARDGLQETVRHCQEAWFHYANRNIADTDFTTDILAFISETSDEYEELKRNTSSAFWSQMDLPGKAIRTADIGNMGEGLIHSHECQRIKINGRSDLIHLIKRIPTQFAMGYDIQSVELDERKRYIEVKTTVSLKPLNFNKLHLTPNEWNTASTVRDRYYVYRLGLNKTEKKLFILQDPVWLYKNDLLEMIPKNGADIIFDINKSGRFEELLLWENTELHPCLQVAEEPISDYLEDSST